MYENLPKNERTFDVKLIGSTTQTLYEGQFTVQCILDIHGTHIMELERTRLLADFANPTELLAGLALALSSLRAKIISAPDWWQNTDQGRTVKDKNVIIALFGQCEEQETKWKDELRTKAEEAAKKDDPEKK